jgi:TolB protein
MKLSTYHLRPRAVLLTAVVVGTLTAASAGGASTFGASAPEQAAGPGPASELSAATSPAPHESLARAGFEGQRNGRIVYYAYLPEIPGMAPEIFTIEPNGRGTLRLTHNELYDQGPSWSPTGRRIVFGRSLGGATNQLFTMRADGSDVRQLTHDQLFSVHPSWSPSGDRIAYGCLDGDDFETGFEICTINLDGTARRQLTDNEDNDFQPVWSPDGRTIAFECSDGDDEEICTMNRDGTGRHQITQSPTFAFSPSYSPSGTWIAYTSDDGTGDLELYVTRADGGGPTYRVTRNSQDDAYASWSPDGTRIAYMHVNAVSSDIYTISPHGLDRRRVTSTEYDETEPQWGRSRSGRSCSSASGRTESTDLIRIDSGRHGHPVP